MWPKHQKNKSSTEASTTMRQKWGGIDRSNNKWIDRTSITNQLQRWNAIDRLLPGTFFTCSLDALMFFMRCDSKNCSFGLRRRCRFVVIRQPSVVRCGCKCNLNVLLDLQLTTVFCSCFPLKTSTRWNLNWPIKAEMKKKKKKQKRQLQQQQQQDTFVLFASAHKHCVRARVLLQSRTTKTRQSIGKLWILENQ